MNPDFMTRYLPEEGGEPSAAAAVVAEPDVGGDPDVAVVSGPQAADVDPPPAPDSGQAPPQWRPAPPGHTSVIAAAPQPRYAQAPPVPYQQPSAASPVVGHPPPSAPDTPAVAGEYADSGGADHLVRAASEQWLSSATHFGAPTSSVPTPLRAEDVVPTRKVPPEMGWRKAVYVGSGHVINLGAGPAEKLLRGQIAAIKTNIPGNYQIAVVGVRGGVGKTRITAGIGTAYASYRKEPVIAIDANPCYGSLGRVVDPSTPSTIREFLADTDFNSYPKARYYTGQNPQGLEVLAANQNVANPLYLSPQRFDAITARTHRFYQLALIDSGPLIEHPVMEAILGSADALVIVGTMNYDGAVAAETTINWLAAHNYHELLRRSALVLNDVYDCADKAFLTKVAETMGRRVGGVTTVPFDAHLRDGAVLDFDALQRKTRLAYIALAAWLAQGFQLVKAGAR